MRIICATITQVSVSTGMAKARSNCPSDSMSLDVGQRRQPAQLHREHQHRRAWPPGTPAPTPRPPRRCEAARSNHEPRHTADGDAERERDRHREQRRSRPPAAASWAAGCRSARPPAAASPTTCRGRRAPGRRASAGSAAGAGTSRPICARSAASASGVASWPSCSCAASPGSTRGDREHHHRHRQQRQHARPMRCASSLTQDERSSPVATRVRLLRARRARRRCSPSGRRAESATGP